MHLFPRSLRDRAARLSAMVALSASAAGLSAQPPLPEAPRVGLFDSVSAVLTRYWPDSAKRRFIVAPLIAEHAPRAAAARTFGEECVVVQALLSKIPSSHLGLMSETAYGTIARALRGEREYTFGMQMMLWDGRWYVAAVLDGGPAQRAGIRTWDEIIAIDGVEPERSGRLDFSTDDAFLTDDRDPPMHPLLTDSLSSAAFTLRTSADVSRDVVLTAGQYSVWEGTAASVRVIESGGLRIGYVHMFYMHMRGGLDWLTDRFSREWANVDAVVLDLRGRGGYGDLADGIAEIFGGGQPNWQRFRGPVVALQDRQTRSAKEILLSRMKTRHLARLVGEPSAGAVVGSTHRSVGHGMVLMMPAQIPGAFFETLELHPVSPDVTVSWGGPLSGGRDPILAAGLAEVAKMATEFGRGAVLPAPIQDTAKFNRKRQNPP